MPRTDWFDDDDTVRSRDRRETGDRNRDNDRAFFNSDRDSSRDRSEMSRRDNFRGDREDRGPARERSSNRDEDRHYGSDDFNRGIPMDETRKLIASNKVEGTPVYDRHGDKLGTIHNFMVDKRKGHVVYAVLKHGGGFLGLNERYYPIEWDQLTYDTRLDGYHVEMVEQDLESFGSFDSDGRWQRRRPEGGRREENQRNRW